MQICRHFLEQQSLFLGFGQIAYKNGQCSVVDTLRQLHLILALEITLFLGADLYHEKNEVLLNGDFFFL